MAAARSCGVVTSATMAWYCCSSNLLASLSRWAWRAGGFPVFMCVVEGGTMMPLPWQICGTEGGRGGGGWVCEGKREKKEERLN